MRRYYYLLTLLVVMNSCSDSGEDWTELSAIPPTYQGTFKIIDFENFKLELTPTRFIEHNEDTRTHDFKRIYLDNSHSSRFSPPLILCEDVDCSRFHQLYWNLDEGYLLRRFCQPGYDNERHCHDATKWVKID